MPSTWGMNGAYGAQKPQSFQHGTPKQAVSTPHGTPKSSPSGQKFLGPVRPNIFSHDFMKPLKTPSASKFLMRQSQQNSSAFLIC